MSEDYTKPGDWHREKYMEFASFKLLAGEPSPHLKILGHFMQGMDLQERVWLLSCQAVPYCVPSGFAVWKNWPWRKAKGANAGAFFDWVKNYWKGIPTKKERRAVRTPEKFTRCLVGCRDWILNGMEGTLSGQVGYEEAWDSAGIIPFFGRYILIRYLEGLRRFCGLEAQLNDIRPKDGWSPRRALSYIFPEQADVLKSDTKDGEELASRFANEILSELQQRAGAANHYILAGTLCEYRQAWEDGGQYPGWTLDQDQLTNEDAEKYWGKEFFSELWEARQAVFPKAGLGELNGWHGTRWPLAVTLRDYGYNWSDSIYDYNSTVFFAEPVRR